MSYRRHAGAATQTEPLPSPSQILAGPDESRHVFAVRAAAQRAQYLIRRADLDPALSATERASLLKAAAAYERMTPRLARRLAMRQAEGARRRSIALVTELLRGSYVSRRRGGLGVWGLLEDAAHVGA